MGAWPVGWNSVIGYAGIGYTFSDATPPVLYSNLSTPITQAKATNLGIDDNPHHELITATIFTSMEASGGFLVTGHEKLVLQVSVTAGAAPLIVTPITLATSFAVHTFTEADLIDLQPPSGPKGQRVYGFEYGIVPPGPDPSQPVYTTGNPFSIYMYEVGKSPFKFTVNVTGGTGTVNHATGDDADPYNTYPITVVPDAGFTLGSLKINNAPFTSGNSFINNPPGNITIDVTLVPVIINAHGTLTYSGGGCDANGTSPISKGGAASFTGYGGGTPFVQDLYLFDIGSATGTITGVPLINNIAFWATAWDIRTRVNSFKVNGVAQIIGQHDFGVFHVVDAPQTGDVSFEVDFTSDNFCVPGIVPPPDTFVTPGGNDGGLGGNPRQPPPTFPPQLPPWEKPTKPNPPISVVPVPDHPMQPPPTKPITGTGFTLSLTKTTDHDLLQFQGTGTFTITVTNTGTVDLANIRLIDSVPDGLIGADVDQSFDLVAGASKVVLVPFTVAAKDTRDITNTAQIFWQGQTSRAFAVVRIYVSEPFPIPYWLDWGTEPHGLIVRWRDNMGRWSKEQTTDWPTGKPGETTNTLHAHGLGRYRMRQYEFVFVDRTPFGLFQVEENISVMADTMAGRENRQR